MEIGIFIILLSLGNLIGQNCVLEMTCFPDSPLEVFSVYSEIYGIPNVVILGIILGIIEGAIYLHNRSGTMLAILGVYTIAALGATAWSEGETSQTFVIIQYIIAFAVGSAVLAGIFKLLRE